MGGDLAREDQLRGALQMGPGMMPWSTIGMSEAAAPATNSTAMASCYSRYSDLMVERTERSHRYTVDGRMCLTFALEWSDYSGLIQAATSRRPGG